MEPRLIWRFTVLLRLRCPFSQRTLLSRIERTEFAFAASTSAGRIPLESGRCRPSSWGKGESWLAEAESRNPWGPLRHPEDVAPPTLFLLSEASIPLPGALIAQ